MEKQGQKKSNFVFGDPEKMSAKTSPKQTKAKKETQAPKQKTENNPWNATQTEAAKVRKTDHQSSSGGSALKRKRSESGSFQTTKKARGKPTDGTEKPGKAPSKDVKKQLAYDAKVLWEESRNTNADHKQKREESMARLLELISGKMFDMVMRRDTSRVIQTILKLGTTEQKSKVQAELAPNILDMTKNNYAHFIVMKMIKYGNAQERSAIIKKFYGHVRELAKHKQASIVLEYAYSQFAKRPEKISLISEFYGREFVLFKDQPKKLDEILTQFPEKKKRVMNAIRDFLIVLSNKVTGVIDNSIVHKPLVQYLEHADYPQKTEMIGFLKDHIVRFLHTKDGAKAALICVKYANTKERKDILKACRDYAGKIAREEFGHVVILECFASIDDTVTLKKSILSGIQNELSDLCKDKFGHLCVLAALQAPSTKYFGPKVLSLLGPVQIPDPADSEKTIMTSKKEASKRQEELRGFFLKPVLSLCQEEAYELITDIYGRSIIDEAFNLCTDPKTKEKIMEELLKWINFDEEAHAKEIEALNQPQRKYHPMEEQPEPEEAKTDLITHTLAHRTIRKFVKRDPAFGEQLWKKIENRLSFYVEHPCASWVVLSLLENSTTKPKVLASLKKMKLKAPEGNKKTALEAILKILKE